MHTGMWTYRPPKRFQADVRHKNLRLAAFKKLTQSKVKTRKPHPLLQTVMEYRFDWAGIPKFVLYARYYCGRKIWLCAFANGLYAQYRAIWATVTRNDWVHSRSHKVELGSVWKIGQLPYGTSICLLENKPGSGQKYARAPGARAIVLGMGDAIHTKCDGVTTSDYSFGKQASESRKVPVLLPSRELKLMDPNCFCVVGAVDGIFHNFTSLGHICRKWFLTLRSPKKHRVSWAPKNAHARHGPKYPHDGGAKWKVHPMGTKGKNHLHRAGSPKA